MSASTQAEPQTAGTGRKPRRSAAQIAADEKKQTALQKAAETRLANKLAKQGRIPVPGTVTQFPAPAEANAAGMRQRANAVVDPVIAGLLVDFPASCASIEKATAWLQVAASTFTLRGLQGSIAITAKAA